MLARTRRQRTRPRSTRFQRGSIGITAAAVLGLMVLVMALAVDTARLYSERRALQSAADIGAMAAINASGFCGYASPVSEGNVEAAVRNAVAANGFNPGTEDAEVLIDLGRVDVDKGMRHFSKTDPQQADSVRVQLTKQVRKSMVAGGLWTEPMTLTTEAVASRQAEASFSVGSYLAHLDTGNSALNPLLSGLLGSSVSLTAADYEALLDATVTLGDLVEGASIAGIGLTAASVNELLAAELSATSLLELTAAAVNRQGFVAADTALGDLYDASFSLPGEIALGDVISLAAGTENPTTARVNLFELITASLMSFQEGRSISLHVAGNGIPYVTGSPSVQLHIVKAPELKVGAPGRLSDGTWRTASKSAQIRTQVYVPIDINLTLLRLRGEIALYVEGARSEAWLRSINCGRHDTNFVRTADFGSRTDVATLWLGRAANLGAASPTVEEAELLDLKLAGVDLAKLAIKVPVEVAGGESHTTVSVPYGTLGEGPVVRHVGMGLSEALYGVLPSLGQGIDIDLELLDIKLWLLKDGVERALEELTSVLLPDVLGAVGEYVLEPLLSALGVDLGGTTITIHSLTTDRTELTY